MAFNEEQRSRIWDRYFLGLSYAYDVFGRPISKNDFEADHIWPESLGGSNIIENGIPLSSFSNQEKKDLTSGYINGIYFEVRQSYDYGTWKVGALFVNGTKVSK